MIARSLPYLAAWFGPAVVLIVSYFAVGATPFSAVVGGVVGGFVGLFGAALALLVKVLQARRTVAEESEHELEALAQATVVANRLRERNRGNCCEAGQRAYLDPCPWHEVPEHEGLRRLHEDIRREQENYPMRRVAPTPDDEPPERG